MTAVGCRHCGRDFKSEQAIRSHLRSCEAWKAKKAAVPAAPKLTAVEKAEFALKDSIKAGKPKKVIDKFARRLETLRGEESSRRLSEANVARVEKAIVAERRDEEKVRRSVAAATIERELRERAAPHAEVHYAGRKVRIDLAHPESIARGTAMEAVRRLVWTVTNNFQDLVTRSRAKLTRPSLPVSDAWLAPLLDSDSGLRYAVRRRLVSVDGHRVGQSENG